MTDNLAERLRNWEHVYDEDDVKPEGSLYLEAADRIEELTEVLEDVDAWVESLGHYVDKGAVLTLVIKKVKAVLGKGYK